MAQSKLRRLREIIDDLPDNSEMVRLVEGLSLTLAHGHQKTISHPPCYLIQRRDPTNGHQAIEHQLSADCKAQITVLKNVAHQQYPNDEIFVQKVNGFRHIWSRNHGAEGDDRSARSNKRRANTVRHSINSHGKSPNTQDYEKAHDNGTNDEGVSPIVN